MDILRPEDKALELLATELGFVVWDKKSETETQQISVEGIDEKNRKPALIKPFTQLT